MATDQVWKLQQGADELDLMASPYRVKTGVIPPDYALEPLIFDTERIDIDDSQSRPFSFEVNLLLSSEVEGRTATRKVVNFLRRGGDNNNPLFLVFNPSSDFDFVAKWGQDGTIYYPIIHGSANMSEFYGDSDMREKGFRIDIDLVLNPYALGQRQRLARATGGIVITQRDGRPNGTIIAPAETNDVTNPFFGHDTYDNGWTTAANIISAEETEPALVRFGRSSAKLTAVASPNRFFTMTINVANTNDNTISFYVRREDGAAVTDSDCDVYYGSAQTGTTFIADPERMGWYIAQATVTGISAGTLLGVIVYTGRTVYVDQFDSVESSQRVIYPINGDMLGCSWAGTAHASASTRAVATLQAPIPEAFGLAEGTYRVALRATHDSSDWSGTPNFLRDQNGIRFNYTVGSTDFRVLDNTNTVDSASLTLSEGDTVVFHVVYGIGELVLYQDGVSIASGSTYTPPTPGSWIYIGTDHSSSNHVNYEYLDFTYFPRAMTSGEVNLDYTNIEPTITAGEALNPIPWLWTKDGDDVVDNDNTASLDNFMVCGGVAGSADAVTEYQIKFTGTEINTSRGIFLSRYDVPVVDGFIEPDNEITRFATTTTSVNTTAVKYDHDATLTNDTRLIEGRGFHLLVRVADAGVNLTAAAAQGYGGATDEITNYIDISTADGTARTFRLPFLQALKRDGILYTTIEPDLIVSAMFKRSVSGAANVTLDNTVIAAIPTLAIDIRNTGATTPVLYIIGRLAYVDDGTLTTGIVLIDLPDIVGDPIDLVPGKLNLIVTVLGAHTFPHTKADSITYNKVIVTPRYTLI